MSASFRSAWPASRFAAALLLGAALLLSCGANDDRRSVVLIVVDTLRQDRMGLYGADRDTTPHLDRFAENAVVFDEAYSTSSWTMPAVASIMTGLYPTSHAMTEVDRVLPDDAVTVAEIFREAGYGTAAVVSHSFVAAEHGMDQGFARFDSENAKGHDDISTNEVTDLAIAELERFAEDPETPFFLFVHYFDPHFNYRDHGDIDFAPPRAGRLDGKQTYGDIRAIRHDMTPEERAFIMDLYDEEIRHTDEGIGRLFATMERLGLMESAVTVFTSDHGEEFIDHGKIGHRKTLYDEVVLVPLLIRYPDATPGRIETPVSTASLAPTMLALAGLPADPLTPQLPSLVDVIEEESGETGTVYFETEKTVRMRGQSTTAENFHGIRYGNWKLIENRETGETELYDLVTDPLEKTNRAAIDTTDLAVLQGHLRRAQRQARSYEGSAAGDRTLSESEVERLKGLGYLGD